MDETERQKYIARIDQLEEALRAIVKHQELIGGGLAVLSATRRIAQEALGHPFRPSDDDHSNQGLM